MSGSVPVVVTGYGCVTALGSSCDIALANLWGGAVNSTHLSGEFFPYPFSAPCFQAKLLEKYSWLPAVLLENRKYAPNRTIQLALQAIDEALLISGLKPEELRNKRVGVSLGTTVGCTFHNESYYIDWKNGRETDSLPLQTYFQANLAQCIQELLGIQGPRAVVTNACASGADAIGLAGVWLEHDLCDMVICGGADELSRVACHGFKSLMLVSTEDCRPFDKDRQGLNLGEGAGIMVLEKEETARAARRPIYGWIRGYGAAGDAYHPTAPHPEGRGLQQAVKFALADADLAISDVAMINGHGTGTPANDRAETRAIKEMGYDTDLLPVVSTKGATGHTLGAAGGIEAVLTLLVLNKGEIRGTLGCMTADPDFPFAPLSLGETRTLIGRIGISQSLAFGGSNAVLVIEGSGK